MDFNRYISAAEFAPLAELFRREGESLFVPKDGCFSFQQVRNRRSGLVEEGAFRYVHATEAGMSSAMPSPGSSSATISRCATTPPRG